MSTSYQEIAFFFDALRQGIREAALPFASTVDLQFRTVRRLGEGEAERFREALEEKANGLIVAPGHAAEVRMWMRKAARQHVPVVCVATDAPKTERLTAVAADAYTAGAMVAECLLRAVHAASSVLIVTGDLSTVDHAEKVRGFREFLSHGAHLSVGPIIEAHDDPQEAYTRVRECLRRDGQLRAVYVSTANSLPVLRALDEVAGQRALSVITTDLFPELIRYLREGRVLATVSQRPHTGPPGVWGLVSISGGRRLSAGAAAPGASSGFAQQSATGAGDPGRATGQPAGGQRRVV